VGVASWRGEMVRRPRKDGVEFLAGIGKKGDRGYEGPFHYRERKKEV